MPQLNFRYVPTVTVFEDVKAAIGEAMEETSTPGVAVAMLHDGEEQAAGFGVTSVENPLDVTPDTLFQIGSITKTFTGTAVMRLVEQGLLDLDAPVRTYLPGLELGDADVAARATMRHLLTHTAAGSGLLRRPRAGDDALARHRGQARHPPQLTPLARSGRTTTRASTSPAG